jgi:hypothetical protein
MGGVGLARTFDDDSEGIRLRCKRWAELGSKQLQTRVERNRGF